PEPPLRFRVHFASKVHGSARDFKFFVRAKLAHGVLPASRWLPQTEINPKSESNPKPEAPMKPQYNCRMIFPTNNESQMTKFRISSFGFRIFTLAATIMAYEPVQIGQTLASGRAARRPGPRLAADLLAFKLEPVRRPYRLSFFPALARLHPGHGRSCRRANRTVPLATLAPRIHPAFRCFRPRLVDF